MHSRFQCLFLLILQTGFPFSSKPPDFLQFFPVFNCNPIFFHVFLSKTFVFCKWNILGISPYPRHQLLNTIIVNAFALDKKGIEFSFSLCYNTSTKCGYNLSVECDLPKVDRWVRLPLPAPKNAPGSTWI